MMTKRHALVFGTLGLILVLVSRMPSVYAQNLQSSQGSFFSPQVQANADPREMSLDLYIAVTRNAPTEAIALRLGDLITLYRYRCTRVTDYQMFLKRPNLLDMKVKCSGNPLYGVTIGSNGYVAVYGGNGMVASLDRRDAIIYSFTGDGSLDRDSRLTPEEALEESMARLKLGNDYNATYMAIMILGAIAIVVVGVFSWIRLWKNRKRTIKSQVTPTQATGRSHLKDRMWDESHEVVKWINYHPAGIYISVGKRGKRRLFGHQFTAALYAKYNWKVFEFSQARVAKLMKTFDEKTADYSETNE